MKKVSMVVLSFALLGVSACSSTTAVLHSPEELSSEQSATPIPKPNDSERRVEIEARMLKGEYLHDGSLDLYSIGDMSSVPALLVVLKEYSPAANGAVVCSAAHALEALRKITGVNPGSTYEAWSSWWEKHQKETAKGSS